MSILGLPLEFFCFGLTLIGVAIFPRWALWISLAGLIGTIAYDLTFSTLPTGPGLSGLANHLSHEWVTLAARLIRNERLADEPSFKLFETEIPETTRIAEALSRTGTRPTFSNKWGTSVIPLLSRLAQETREALDGA